MVEAGPLVDGVTAERTVTVDGLTFERYAQVLRRGRRLPEIPIGRQDAERDSSEMLFHFEHAVRFPELKLDQLDPRTDGVVSVNDGAEQHS